MIRGSVHRQASPAVFACQHKREPLCVRIGYVVFVLHFLECNITISFDYSCFIKLKSVSSTKLFATLEGSSWISSSSWMTAFDQLDDPAGVNSSHATVQIMHSSYNPLVYNFYFISIVSFLTVLSSLQVSVISSILRFPPSSLFLPLYIRINFITLLTNLYFWFSM